MTTTHRAMARSAAGVAGAGLLLSVGIAAATPASAGPFNIPEPPTCEANQFAYVDGGFYNYGKVLERKETSPVQTGQGVVENTFYGYIAQVPNIPAGWVPIGSVEKLCETRVLG